MSRRPLTVDNDGRVHNPRKHAGDSTDDEDAPSREYQLVGSVCWVHAYDGWYRTLPQTSESPQAARQSKVQEAMSCGKAAG